TFVDTVHNAVFSSGTALNTALCTVSTNVIRRSTPSRQRKTSPVIKPVALARAGAGNGVRIAMTHAVATSKATAATENGNSGDTPNSAPASTGPTSPAAASRAVSV